MVFSGSGRHRRPTQADRAIAAAGVASVGLALPLLTASGAHAAPVKTWDAVAQCETGGNWSADDGQGHYGGLGLTQRAWVSHGGDKYAAEPDHATRSQQIAVAERVLEDSGTGLWPNCAAQAGLTDQGGKGGRHDDGDKGRQNDDGDKAGTAPGSQASATPTPAPAPDAPAAAPTPSVPSADTTPPGTPAPTFPGRAGYDPAAGVYWYQDNGVWHWTVQHDIYIKHMDSAAATAQPSAGTDTTSPSPAAPGTSQPAQPGVPTTGATPSMPATGTPAPGSATGTPQLPGTPTAGSGAAAAPVTPASPAAPAQPSAPSTANTPAAPQTYTVERGDTLSAIAESHKLTGWQHLYEENKALIGANPDLILPGQSLHLQQH
ncbi:MULTISPECIES: transglycosylase family protein [Kitasatospora]|uniref:Resuscitation-promoting factor protein RpfC n=1 Tax=Kitasatospora cystarginea TaxID=58350 RepID=A0ABN3E9T8_9ACTN